MQGSDSKLAVAVAFFAVYQKRGLHVGIYTAADLTITLAIHLLNACP